MLKKIFISYASEDQAIVDRLRTELGNAGQLWVYENSLQKGKNLRRQIDEALGDSDYLLPVITRNYFSSDPAMDELYSFMGQHQDQIIPLFFEYVPDLKKRPMVASRWGIPFYDSFEKGIAELLESIKGDGGPIRAYGIIQRPGEVNPFGNVRAEFFNHSLLASTFYEPEKEKYDLLRGPKPVILEGGRGSGKTMLLRSLEAVTATEISGKKTFAESGLGYFGVYLKFNRGSFALSRTEEVDGIGESEAKVLFLDDLNLEFAEATIETIEDCRKRLSLTLGGETESLLCRDILGILRPDAVEDVESFGKLLAWIAVEKAKIRRFVGQILMGTKTQYDGCYSGIDAFKKICTRIVSRVSRSDPCDGVSAARRV